MHLYPDQLAICTLNIWIRSSKENKVNLRNTVWNSPHLRTWVHQFWADWDCLKSPLVLLHESRSEGFVTQYNFSQSSWGTLLSGIKTEQHALSFWQRCRAGKNGTVFYLKNKEDGLFKGAFWCAGEVFFAYCWRYASKKVWCWTPRTQFISRISSNILSVKET